MSLVKKFLKPFSNQLNPAFTTSIYRKDPLFSILRDFESDMIQPFIAQASLPVDIKESEKDFELVADMPGFTKNEINCMIDEDKHLLTLKGEKQQSKEDKEGNYIIKERYYNTFTRHFDIPSNAKLDQIKAQFKDGQLKLTIPKSDEKLLEKDMHIKKIEIAE